MLMKIVCVTLFLNVINCMKSDTCVCERNYQLKIFAIYDVMHHPFTLTSLSQPISVEQIYRNHSCMYGGFYCCPLLCLYGSNHKYTGYMHTCLHTYIHTYMYICLHKNIKTTCMHKFTYIHIHSARVHFHLSSFLNKRQYTARIALIFTLNMGYAKTNAENIRVIVEICLHALCSSWIEFTIFNLLNFAAPYWLIKSLLSVFYRTSV